MKARKARNGVVGAVHERDGRLFVLALREDAGQRRLLDGLECGADATGELRTWLEARGVVRLVRIVPLRQSLCKTAALAGVTDEAALAQSVTLMAEGALPPGVPWFRRAGGPLHGNVGGAILTAWMSRQTPEPLSELPETWITPHGALAAMWDGKHPAVYSDGVQGAAGLLLAGPAGAVARVALAAPGTPEAWGATLAGIVNETSHAAGVSLAWPETHGDGLVIDASCQARVREELAGAGETQAWFDRFGLCAGALMAATSRRQSVRALANLHATEPPRERSAGEIAVHWLANPVNAWLLAAGCVLLAVALPWLFAFGRQEVLRARAAKFEKFSGGVGDIEKQGALYRQLEQSRWPMTKLLTDVSRAAPTGVTAINLRLAIGQPLSVHGSAPSADLVNEFQARLAKTKVFGKVTVGRVEAKGEGVEFDLSADVTQPSVPVNGAEDFASAGKTLAERLYGAGASNLAVAPKSEASRRGDSSSRGGAGGRSGDERGTRGGGGSGGSGGGGGGSASSDELPAPVSDAEIAKMTNVELLRGWTGRQAYMQKHPELDSATKQRLTDERDKMKARAAELRQKGGT